MLMSAPLEQQLYDSSSVMLIPPLTPYSVKWAGGKGSWKELYFVFDPLPQWNPLLSWPTSRCGQGILHLPNPTVVDEVRAALEAAFRISHQDV